MIYLIYFFHLTYKFQNLIHTHYNNYLIQKFHFHNFFQHISIFKFQVRFNLKVLNFKKFQQNNFQSFHINNHLFILMHNFLIFINSLQTLIIVLIFLKILFLIYKFFFFLILIQNYVIFYMLLILINFNLFLNILNTLNINAMLLHLSMD